MSALFDTPGNGPFPEKVDLFAPLELRYLTDADIEVLRQEALAEGKEVIELPVRFALRLVCDWRNMVQLLDDTTQGGTE